MKDKSKIVNWISLVCFIITMICCVINNDITYLRTIAISSVVTLIVINVIVLTNKWEL